MSEEELEQWKTANFVFARTALDDRGLPGWIFKQAEEDQILYTEEILAMIFSHGRQLAIKQSGGDVKGCVITVPSYFNANKRRMIEDAADLAGLQVFQLIHENTAVATMHGLNRQDFNSTHTVMFYNMGGKDTEVSVVRYGGITDDKGKNYEHIEILAETYEEDLGSTNVDTAILNELAKRFDGLKERDGKSSVFENKRAINRLKKESIKAKEVLSANKETLIKVAELVDYDTLNTKLERTELEQLLT